MTSTPMPKYDGSLQPDAFRDIRTVPDSDGEPESPSLTTPQVSRFEFEHGKGNEGTRILIVEWEDDDRTKNVEGKWTVSWENKSTVLLAEERTLADDARATTQSHRMFFMLAPGISIPATVTLAFTAIEKVKDCVILRTNPLPAILPPNFAETAVDGKMSRGVLHTLWAKKRLATLKREIAKEEKEFPEGIALDMAVQEKAWIEESFGLDPPSDMLTHQQHARGLGDVPHSPLPAEPTPRIYVPQLLSQPSNPGNVGSLITILDAGFAPLPACGTDEEEGDGEHELFALPLSPRSPEMSKSPFTFASIDTL